MLDEVSMVALVYHLASRVSNQQVKSRDPIYLVNVQKMKVYSPWLVYSNHFLKSIELVGHDSFCAGFKQYRHGCHCLYYNHKEIEVFWRYYQNLGTFYLRNYPSSRCFLDVSIKANKWYKVTYIRRESLCHHNSLKRCQIRSYVRPLSCLSSDLLGKKLILTC